MGEPLTRAGEIDAPFDDLLGRAVGRLERALDTLDAALAGQGSGAATSLPATSERVEAMVIELEAARRRGRELETVAAGASAALGRAAAEVRRTLDEDAGRQGLFDFADAPGAEELEADAPLVQEEAAAPAEEEPAA